MLYDLLKINNVTFPKPAKFDISLEDKTNEFNAENGTRTIEVIRENIASINVGYDSLTAATYQTARAALAKVSQVQYYNPATQTLRTVQMEVSNIASSKNYHDNNISTWSLSFNLREL